MICGSRGGGAGEPGRKPVSEASEQPMDMEKGKEKDRAQRSYFLDRDIDKALRRMALEEGKNLTETVNDLLRRGLGEYLK